MSTAQAPPPKKTNRVGLEVISYRGSKTTLCAGCGHNSITERLIECFFEMGIEPWRVAKFSGIGCSSKSPAYFLGMSHGFNGVHGRAPAIATGAMLANKNLLGIVVTGDGDTVSIGIGQFIHMLRRNVPLIYVIENNGVYGLTKGQFSATSDAGAKSKSGVINELQPVDCCVEAIQIGATFVARSFSGDKRQLQAILKAAIAHRGLSVIDVISPCVTFNDHEGSTKSYSFMKDHDEPLHELDFVPFFTDIEVEIEEGAVQDIEMHDGSRLRLHKLEHDHDPTDRLQALSLIQASKEASEVLTGVLYLDTARENFLELLNTVDQPLATLDAARTRPSREALQTLMDELR
jgi:2-oxoglutarate ferredoxin oxidoreductase subunit beta